MSIVFVGRQPIYNRELATVAFELLFRSGEENHANFADGDQATAELILNTFTEIGLEQVVGSVPAFVNLPENFILDGHAYLLPTDRVVLEVLEDVRPTDMVLSALSALRDEGYTIAIDDFVYSPELMPLVKLANIVKVDLPAITKDELPKHVAILRQHNVRILAEKVETQEEFEFCKELGFDYFQGYFFCKPSIVKRKQIPTNRVTMMRLITRLQSPTASLAEIAEVIRTEPSLAYKLLMFVNSAYCGLTNKVESIQHAVALAGIHRIKTMSCLSILSNAADDKPIQLVQTLLIRARMAELLAERAGQRKTDSFFLAGLFSAIDALLDVSMEEALAMVPVNKDVRDALTERKGFVGMVLECVLAYEKGDWAHVECRSLDDDSIRNAYLQAISWVADSEEQNSHKKRKDTAAALL